MKATGVVRRVDDLGRIVIPKEIRRTMRIREGEPMEIFIDSGGSVVFRKYSPMGGLAEVAVQLAEALAREAERPCVICDRDGVIACSGVKAQGERISREAESLMESRRPYKGDPMEIIEGGPMADIIIPVIAGGDLSGCVALVVGQNPGREDDARLARMTAGFMARCMED